MSFEETFQSGTKRWRVAVIGAAMGAVLSVPATMYAHSNVVAQGYAITGAPGQAANGCASCHGTLTVPSVVTVNAPSSYTAGQTVNMTVTIPSSGAFELAVLSAPPANASVGTLSTTDANAGTLTVGGVQMIGSTTTATSWNFTWVAPASGNVVLYVTGGSFGANSVNSYSITGPAAGGGNTLTVSPTSLTFNSAGGVVPPPQTFQVTSSGAPLAFTTSVSTTDGGTWLSAAPPGGTTSQTETVSINPAGLTANTTYTGTVMVAAAATNSPQTVSVTLNVGSASSTPSLGLNPTAMTFTSVNGGTVNSQNVQVTSTGSPLTFTAAAATTSGGNWLSVSPTTGTTTSSVTVMADPTGLSVGTTYMGSVTFTSSGASNSGLTLPVTLVMSAQQPPPTNPGPLTFKFLGLGTQSNGTDGLLVDGTGAVNSSGTLSGSGGFVIYSGGGSAAPATKSTGTWKATSITGFTPPATSGSDDDSGGGSGGVLTIKVQISPMGAAAVTGTMTISATGIATGITLAIDGGATYMPSGVGSVSVQTGRSGGGDDGGTGRTGGGGTGGDDGLGRRTPPARSLQPR